MPSLAVHIGMTMTCPHGGLVTIAPLGPPPVVIHKTLGMTTLSDRMTVVGCMNTPQCTAVQWANVNPSVLVDDEPILVQFPPPSGPPGVPAGGVCVGPVPPVTPLVLAMQTSVITR
jgi:hypothetical protein